VAVTGGGCVILYLLTYLGIKHALLLVTYIVISTLISIEFCRFHFCVGCGLSTTNKLIVLLLLCLTYSDIMHFSIRFHSTLLVAVCAGALAVNTEQCYCKLASETDGSCRRVEVIDGRH